jgi:hypothetical protein
MTDYEWMAYRSAAALIGDEDAVLSALMTGAIKSRGRRDYHPANLWAEWTFLPRKGSEHMRKFCWLVPPGKELSRVCRGFGEIRLSRVDVERLAEPEAAVAATTLEPPHFGRPVAGPRTDPPPGGKVGAIAAALRREFPHGAPPAMNVKELRAWLEKSDPTIGGISDRNLTRARVEVWPELRAK